MFSEIADAPSYSPIVRPFSKKDLLSLKLERLKREDLFKAIPESTLELIAENSIDIILKKDEVLFREGDREKNIKIYVILSGELVIYKGTRFKRRITVLKPGQFVGELAMIDSQPRSASAVALNEVVLMEIREDLFYKYIASDPKALLEMMKVLSYRIRHDLDVMAGDMQKVSNFTHDMRNCLVPLGISETLLENSRNALQGTDPNHKKRLGWDNIEKGLKTMLSVRNNLITLIDQSLACVKKASSDYVKVKLDICPLIRETAEEILCHKFLRGKNINIQCGGNIRPGYFNQLDIKRVLQNLLINAGYVTPTEGTIDIFVKDLNDSNQVSIRDHGLGIGDEIKDILFRETFTNKPDGNGFGLMSCREIIEDYHKGRIWFETELGKGSTFHFTIPHFNN